MFAGGTRDGAFRLSLSRMERSNQYSAGGGGCTSWANVPTTTTQTPSTTLPTTTAAYQQHIFNLRLEKVPTLWKALCLVPVPK